MIKKSKSELLNTDDNFLTPKEQTRKRNILANMERQVKARKPVSAPAGQKQRMIALREKLLSEGNTETVLRKIIQIIKDDEHPAQAAMLKLCADRMMPVSMFEDKKDGSRTAITINISGIGEDTGVTIDGERGDMNDDVGDDIPLNAGDFSEE